MSDTNNPNQNPSDFQPLPIIDSHDLSALYDGIDSVYKGDKLPPAFIARSERIVPDQRARALGAAVVNYQGLLLRPPSQYVEQVLTRSVHGEEHLDGLDKPIYAEIHNHAGGPLSEVTLRVRELDTAAQSDLRDYLADRRKRGESEGGYDDSEYLRDLPDSVSKLAPIVAQYRSFLEPKMSVVFRNGFHVAQITDAPKRLVTHEFRSVNDAHEPVDESRTVDLGYVGLIAPRPPRGGLFGRRRQR